MKFWGLITIFIVLICLIWWLKHTYFQNSNEIYHIMIVSKNVVLKPDLPSKQSSDYLVIINQSTFHFNDDVNNNQFYFRVDNKSLSTLDLELISKDLVPKESETKVYIF